jgi:hypothetical protein
VPQPNFQYGNAIFGHMGSSKEAAQKSKIINYEQLFSLFFSFFRGLKKNLKKFKAIVAAALQSWI